jgi:hypothetical protein
MEADVYIKMVPSPATSHCGDYRAIEIVRFHATTCMEKAVQSTVRIDRLISGVMDNSNETDQLNERQ